MISDADKAELRRDERHAEQQEILWDEARDAAWDEHKALHEPPWVVCDGCELCAEEREEMLK